MRPEVVRRHIASFGKRFGKAHLYLAYHAAFPLALTPDLLYRLWANFQCDIHGRVLGIPWVTVADLLLSSLCDEVGYELYEMDTAVRNALLSDLKDDPDLGPQRIDELSNFLLDYVRQQLHSNDPDIRDFAQAQQWTALSYLWPDEAVRELALAFSRLDQQNRVEWIRMKSLVETLAEPLKPLAEFALLLIYARGMASFARGNLKGSAAQLSQVVERGRQLQVAEVFLPVPEVIFREIEVLEPRPRLAVGAKLVRIVTNMSRLAASRPDDPLFLDRIQAALAEWETGLASQRIRPELVQTDDLANGSRGGEAKRVRRHLLHLQGQQKADYILILGGDDIVPFYRLPDPVEELIAEAAYWTRENDRLIYSDDPYVSDDDYLFRPKHPIGRLPHGQGQHDDLLIELLRRSARYHRQNWPPVRRLALTTQSWRSKSQLVWPAAKRWYECPPCRLPPPYDAAPTCAVGQALLADETCFVDRSLLSDKTLHYYNLHGKKHSIWSGECACDEGASGAHEDSLPFIPCLQPALSVAQIPLLPPAVIISTTCYSGFTTRSKPPRNLQNLALGFLRQGAITFIGVTARAYTEMYPIESINYADWVAQTFLKLVEENQAVSSQRRIGEIWQAVKNNYQLGYNPSPLDFKTLWEFVLYGDPTLIPFRSVETQEKAI